MQTEKLEIGHKDLLCSLLKKTNSRLSEYTFANLYLFRANHAYEVVRNGGIFIKGKTYDGHTYLMPTADARRLDLSSLKGLMNDVEFLFPIPEEWLPAFSTEEFSVTFNEGDQDYVYAVEKMSTYRGRHLHKKRNLLKQFLGSYAHDARPLTSDRIDEARFILNDWLQTTGVRGEDNDYGPCLEALDRYEELVLCGGIYYAAGEPAGFILGEELDRESFVLHFAKGRIKFKGIYQYMYNTFAAILPAQYKYLNLEQDLDKENLRIFKSSYAPDALLKKARVSLRKP